MSSHILIDRYIIIFINKISDIVDQLVMFYPGQSSHSGIQFKPIRTGVIAIYLFANSMDLVESPANQIIKSKCVQSDWKLVNNM